jgi:Ca2+-binding EF-hand superfamily protein
MPPCAPFQSKASIARCSLADASAKRACYLQQRDKFTSMLQDEVSYGRELVSTRFQIGSKALQTVYERLGYPMSTFGKSFADDLIWQVNDALDGAISFDEFERSYMRARSDRTGMEPAELFYLTCFLMFDKECAGKVDHDTLDGQSTRRS